MVTKLGDTSLIEALAMRLVPGAKFWNKFGAGNIGTSPGTVFSGPSTAGLYEYPDSIRTVWVASTSTNDTFGGSGCQYIHISGLDANRDEIEEVIVMNGQTPVESQNEYYIVHRMLNADVGTHDIQGQVYLSFDGPPTWSGGEPDTIQGHINNGSNQSQLAIYSVPRGYKLLITNWDMNSMKAKEMEMWLAGRFTAQNDRSQSPVFRMLANYGLYRSNIALSQPNTPIVFDPLDEIEVRAVNLNSGSDVVYTTLVGYLVPEKYFGDYVKPGTA